MTAVEDIVDQKIRSLSTLGFHSLRFPPELEQEFELKTRPARCKRLWFEGLVAIGLFDIFFVIDRLVSPGKPWFGVLLGLCVVTPLALAVNVSMLFHPPEFLRESSIAAVACLAGISELIVGANRSPLNSAYAQFCIGAVLLFTNTVMRLRFPYAVASTAIMGASELVFLRYGSGLPHGGKLLGLYLTICAMVITMVANYNQNREERLNFLLRRRAYSTLQKLTDAHESLSVVAQLDPLTGLSNRYALDTELAVIWRSFTSTGRIVSLILCDVDHFKNVNDTYGHLFGDKVLRRVGSLITEALRKENDFAARLGGDEFVIVLPDTTIESAELVAQRLSKLVELAGLPAHDGLETTPNGVSICCGVACASPADVAQQILFEAADSALYRAKNSGRNAVCIAGQEPLPQNSAS